MAGGMELHFFGLWDFEFRSLKSGENRSFCGIAGIYLQISGSENYFSDSGKWPFHTPPIHTPTKCQPINITFLFWSGSGWPCDNRPVNRERTALQGTWWPRKGKRGPCNRNGAPFGCAEPPLNCFLCILSRNILWIFLRISLGFGVEKWRRFFVNFFWFPFPGKQCTKNPRKFLGNFGGKFLSFGPSQMISPASGTSPCASEYKSWWVQEFFALLLEAHPLRGFYRWEVLWRLDLRIWGDPMSAPKFPRTPLEQAFSRTLGQKWGATILQI